MRIEPASKNIYFSLTGEKKKNLEWKTSPLLLAGFLKNEGSPYRSANSSPQRV